MAKQSVIDKIYKDNLCLGCGLCQSICGKDNVEMQLQSTGFFKPVIKTKVPVEKDRIIKNICPGINVVNDLKITKERRVWGSMEQLFSGFSTDKEIRTQGSSGGIISAVAIYMLQHKLVDGVMQVGGDAADFQRNTLQVSRTKKDVLRCASSRYAPALVFDRILELLNENGDVYCFIGKPCDISALKNFLSHYPQYQQRFALTVSIMCAGMPSFAGTQAIVKEFNAVEPVKNLVYRGNGWPGFFSFKDSTDKEYKMTYNDSWGKRLGKHLHQRCKICPDGIGIQADIAVGDAWETADGYPDFTEREGRSLVIVRTQRAVQLLEAAAQSGDMKFEPLEEQAIGKMQPYQYRRRMRVGARVLAFCLGKRRIINYKHLQLWNNVRAESPVILLREFVGTFKRVIKS